jgi:ribosomal protein S27AE
MASQTKKMICPKCGDEMNHHADKLVYQDAPAASQADSGLGGVIEEAHYCPGCGAIESRRAG